MVNEYIEIERNDAAATLFAYPLAARLHDRQADEQTIAWGTLKKLEDDWIAQDDTTGEASTAAFSCTPASERNAILDTSGPGLPTEEITLYFHDGDNLVLNRNCPLGNQARMQPRQSRLPRVEWRGGSHPTVVVHPRRHRDCVIRPPPLTSYFYRRLGTAVHMHQ